MEPSLSTKVSRGIFWVTTASLWTRGLQVIVAVILTRILDPADFGIVAVCTAIIAFSQGATNLGFQSALIQKQERPEDFLDTAWTMEILRNVLLAVLIIGFAPLFESLFREPRLPAILRVMAISITLQGFRNIGVIYFRKNLDFFQQFIFEGIPILAYVATVIPLAFMLKNAWALVLAFLANNIMSLVISYVIHEYRPKLDFNLKKAKTLFQFGKWIFGSSLIAMIREQGITLFIGHLLGMTVLGFYNRAQVFSRQIFRQMIGIVWKIGFSLYSKIQTDRKKLIRTCLKTIKLLSLFGFPTAAGIIIISRELTVSLLTEKWLPIVPLVRLMCLEAFLLFITTPITIAFQSVGRPDVGTKISVISTIVLVIIVYPLSTLWGVVGIISSIVISSFITLPFILYQSSKIIGLRIYEIIGSISFPLLNSLIMIVFLHYLKNYIVTYEGFKALILLIISGGFCYTITTLLLDELFHFGAFRLIEDRILSLRDQRFSE